MLFLSALASYISLTYNINNSQISKYYWMQLGVICVICGILGIAFFSFVFMFMDEAIGTTGIQAQLERMYPESDMTVKGKFYLVYFGSRSNIFRWIIPC